MTDAAAARAHIATVVVSGPAPRLAEAAGLLAQVDRAGGLRAVFIATEGAALTDLADVPDAVAIAGLDPRFLNNAIAAVRLSSLPTVVWWRGGHPERLDGVAALADRIILDGDDVGPLWRRAMTLFDEAAFTDVRWARLTRWRAVMAHFFDVPAVREACAGLARLSIAGRDRAQCGLFASWLDASLGWKGRVQVRVEEGPAAAPMAAVELAGDGTRLSLRLLPDSSCLDASARLGDRVLASSVFSLGDQRLPALLSEELRVRSRDVAFEGAVRSFESLKLAG